MPCPPPGDLPSPGIKPRSPPLHADSLPSEPLGKPRNPGVGSLSLLQGNFQIEESNWGLLHCRWVLYQLSYQRILVHMDAGPHTQTHTLHITAGRPRPLGKSLSRQQSYYYISVSIFRIKLFIFLIIYMFFRRRKWQSTPVFLPEKSGGQRSLAGYSPLGCKKSWTQLSDKTTHTILNRFILI